MRSWFSFRIPAWRSESATTILRRAFAAVAAVAVVLPVTMIGAPGAQASSTDCRSDGYACTPGYDATNTKGTWAWAHYGGANAINANGYHNCTLYAAWRLEQDGLADPGNWGNAVDWINHASYDHTPSIGSIAWWGKEVAGGFGHVAYVDQVSGNQVYVVADNYVGPHSDGYTDADWIPASSVDEFLHPLAQLWAGSPVAVTGNADGRLELFGVNSVGNVWHRWQLTPGGAWSAWTQFDGALTNVAAATNADGRIELFGTNSAGNVWHRWQLTPGGAWSAWTQFDGALRP